MISRAAVLAFLLLGCGGGGSGDGAPSPTRRKTALAHGDSVRAVRLARRALGDTLALSVDALTRGSEGWLVRLLPERGGTAGGGEVWVERDSSATVVKRY